jgi:hypothetical protein
MWVFTSHGFISIVQHLHHEECFQVKARVPHPLQQLWPDHEIQVIDWADYRYRINIRKDEVIPVVEEAVREIDYSSFKNECEWDGGYHRALVSIWNTMYRFQSEREMSESVRSRPS